MRKVQIVEQTVSEIHYELDQPWTLGGTPFTSDMIEKNYAFVYLIKDTKTGKGYIGKKLFWSKKQKVIKGKKKSIKVESDWKTYWSSSEEIQRLVSERRGDFTREILHLCINKGSANYLEAREQMDHRVLERPDLWYNGQIQCRVHWTHVKLGY